MTVKRQQIIAIAGQTCTYKSKLAIDLAKRFPFEIISADSRLIYKEMDIGTSKPALEDRKLITHHMIDVASPNENYSVALYKKEAEEKIKQIFLRDKIPLFVGGTGLYLNSVLLGFSIPEVKPDLSFRRQLKDMPQEELYKRLSELDLEAAAKIHKNDNFRTVRALEVIYKTNKLFSSLKTSVELPFDVYWIGLMYKDRDLHQEKIKKRTSELFNNGFLDEVKNLLSKYGELDLFKNTIGYKEAVEHLKGWISFNELIEKITLHTRQFAKRQITWFKANKKINWICLDDLSYESVFEYVLRDIGSFAKTSMVSIS